MHVLCTVLLLTAYVRTRVLSPLGLALCATIKFALQHVQKTVRNAEQRQLDAFESSNPVALESSDSESDYNDSENDFDGSNFNGFDASGDSDDVDSGALDQVIPITTRPSRPSKRVARGETTPAPFAKYAKADAVCHMQMQTRFTPRVYFAHSLPANATPCVCTGVCRCVRCVCFNACTQSLGGTSAPRQCTSTIFARPLFRPSSW